MRMAELAARDRHYQVLRRPGQTSRTQSRCSSRSGDWPVWTSCTGVTSTRTASRSLTGCATTCHTLAPCSWAGPPCWATGTRAPPSHPRPPRNFDRLDQAESALYADLISNAYAPSVRLEHERISFSAVEKAIVGRTTVAPGLLDHDLVAQEGRINVAGDARPGVVGQGHGGTADHEHVRDDTLRARRLPGVVKARSRKRLFQDQIEWICAWALWQATAQAEARGRVTVFCGGSGRRAGSCL